MFNGFFSFDAKFWKTIIPLLTKPGLVSKNFVEGKRNRYSNPFRFYLTISVFFFLTLGVSMSKKKFEAYNKAYKVSKIDSLATKTNNDSIKKETKTAKIKNIEAKVSEQINNFIVPLPDNLKDEIIKEAIENNQDSLAINIGDGNSFSFDGLGKLSSFHKYQKKYPNLEVDEALDSLGFEKNFKNRFLYTRVETLTSLAKKNNRDKLINDLLSYGSISLFIFLPLFTLFLKLLYIRRKHTYVNHLIFVFHTQTVFFMLLTLFTIVNIFTNISNLWVLLLLFLVYLFLAMKKFYQQGYLKTTLKFLLLNIVYIQMASLGVVLVALLSFALY
ncbi:DUF3667 domain-containing protein [Polaribacter tangerinus]|uniref:DUF3667 domain-containing protein n=1 Tax=Polaribacter tangerinus TaxID=1920034 RepID=UPI0021CF53A7